MKIAIKDLKPNPFKKYINKGVLNKDKIECLKESIEKDGFWDNILCRRNSKGEYELAYGHHRIEAVKQVFGKDFEVNIPCKDLSDEAMLRILGNENNPKNEEYAVYQIDQVVATKKFLEENPDILIPMRTLSGRMDGSGHQLESGSASTISWFLGVKNWSKSKVADLLRMAEKLHPTIIEEIKNINNVGTPKESASISVAHGQRIAQLDNQKDQLKAFNLIKKHKLSTREAEVVVDKIKQEKDFKLIDIKNEKRSDKPMLEEVVRDVVKKLNAQLPILKSIVAHTKDLRNGSLILLGGCLGEYKSLTERFEKERKDNEEIR